MDKLVIAGKKFNSRLLVGTGKFSSNELMSEAIEKSGTEIVTVALRRVDIENKTSGGKQDYFPIIEPPTWAKSDDEDWESERPSR